MLTKNPYLTASEEKDILLNSADQIGGVTYTSGHNDYYGHGRVNAEAALEAVYAFTVDSVVDAPDASIGDGTAEDSLGNVTLRAAIQEANADPSNTYTIVVPEGVYTLDHTGAELSNASFNDLDITGDVRIIGIGAGRTVIDGGGAGGTLQDRVFQVTATGQLDLMRTTVTGGFVTGAGGGINVALGGELVLADSAIVANNSTGSGGGLYNRDTTTVLSSVFSDNYSGSYGGGLLSSGAGSNLTVGNSIFANNSAGIGRPDFRVANGGTGVNLGNNMVTSYDPDQVFLNIDDGDLLNQSVDYVVTSVADTANTNPSNHVLSLREAVIEANTNNDIIWVPAWRHRLTREGSGNATGDLDVTGNVTIVGVGPGLTVIDGGGATGIQDRLFEVTATGELNLSRTTVTGGFSPDDGGGIYVEVGAELTLTESAVVKNEAFSSSSGGGLYNKGTATVLDSVFSDNTSDKWGGGLISLASNSDLTVGNSIFANNFATLGRPDFRVANGGTGTNLGNNMVTSYDPDQVFLSVDDGDLLNQPVDYVVTSVADTANYLSNNVLSLREAVIEANDNSDIIWVPAWRHRLTRQGSGIDAGDLDVTGNVTIVGVGPGLTVIDGGGATGILQDRLFEVTATGDLDLSRTTVTGGFSTQDGGGIYVDVGGELTLTESAIVKNEASSSSSGGGLYNKGTATVLDSVFSDNTTDKWGGGLISLASNSDLTVGNSIFANNSATLGRPDFRVANGGTGMNLGNNMVTIYDPDQSFLSAADGDLLNQPVDYVVTSLADAVNQDDDELVLSLREAVILSNNSTGAESIWLPAWTFRLTIPRTSPTAETDMDAAFGDLDITDTLTVRGIVTDTTVDGSAVEVDAVFDLLGDFNSDGQVDGLDFNLWDNGDPLADANGDGVVDSEDFDVWDANRFNILSLINVILIV